MPLRPSPDTLAISRSVLRILIRLNLLMGVLILALLVASLVAPRPVIGALGFPQAAITSSLLAGARLIMLVGIAAVPITNALLGRLAAIVETVRVGDPFVTENATRLQQIAWALLSLEVLHLVVVAASASMSTPELPLRIGGDYSLTRWLGVLLLFVLARVFEHGARMRQDLEGTV